MEKGATGLTRTVRAMLTGMVLVLFVPTGLAAQPDAASVDVDGLMARVETWRRSSPQAIKTPDLQAALTQIDALKRDSAIDFTQFDKVYEAGKAMIRRGQFLDPNYQRPSEWSSFKHEFDRQLAEEQASRTQYKLGLMKRLTVAYVGAVASRFTAPPPCHPNGVAGLVTIDGHDLPTVHCPHPHLDGLRDYVGAIHLIQSADADRLAAEMDVLVAEQQLAVDIMAGFPLVGEALDAYALYAGENLAGAKMHFIERGLTAVFLALPILGPKAAKSIKEAVEASPRAMEGVVQMHAFLEAISETSAWLKDGAQDQGRYMMEVAAQKWGTSADKIIELRDLLKGVMDDLADRMKPGAAGKPFKPGVGPGPRTALGAAPEPDPKWFLYHKLREAAAGRLDILDLPKAWRARALQSATELVEQGLLKVQPASRRAAIARSGMVHAHGEAFAHVAKKRGEIYLVREVNPASTGLIARNFGTKPMAIKAKSASSGIIAGAIPVDQALNKTGDALERARAALTGAAPGSDAYKAASAAVEEAQKALGKGWETIEKCFTPPPCAKKVEFPRPDGKIVHKAVDPASGKAVLVVDGGGGKWLNADTDAPISFIPGETPAAVEVLADAETGKILTADYDMLAFGATGKHETPRFSSETGFVTPGQQDAIHDLNAAVQGADPRFDPADFGGTPYEGGNVTHHGAEENFFASPGVEGDVVTAYQPNGNVVSIPKCDRECMKAWCRIKGPGGVLRCDPSKLCQAGQTKQCLPIDPDRLLKDYFHMMRLAGFNLDPNPRWGWGNYNALGGWLSGLHCQWCDAALWPKP